MYSSFLKVADSCSVCGLRLDNHDTGDGPAFFVMMPLCLVAVFVALGLELIFSPPLWFHLIFWPVFLFGVALASLPPVKAVMIALQYRHRDVETYDPSNQQ